MRSILLEYTPGHEYPGLFKENGGCDYAAFAEVSSLYSRLSEWMSLSMVSRNRNEFLRLLKRHVIS